jgi:hypothetical protein
MNELNKMKLNLTNHIGTNIKLWFRHSDTKINQCFFNEGVLNSLSIVGDELICVINNGKAKLKIDTKFELI